MSIRTDKIILGVMAAASLGVIAAISIVMGNLEQGHAKVLVERRGEAVVVFKRQWFSCYSNKGRVGFHFKTETGRTGKICVGAGQRYRITYQ